MTDPELKEAVKEAVRKTDPDADDLRSTAEWLRQTAAKWDLLDE